MARLDYQTEIKLHHPYFGRKHMFCFTIAYSMYLLDTFIMLSVPQLIIISLLIVFMLFWRDLVVGRHKALFVILRFIQVLTILQALFAFFLQLPIVGDSWTKSHLRLVNSLGLMGCKEKQGFIAERFDVYSRFHRVALCLAVVSTEVYIVSSKVYERQL